MLKQYVEMNEWHVIENEFHETENKIYESLTSLGNGYMGMRGNFEETFSGSTLQGTYIAGVYYPDKTRVGWWKNGYPEYFAKVLNATNFIGIRVIIDGQEIDLSKVEIKNFVRDLNMKDGTLSRTCTIIHDNKETKIETLRFLSKARKEICALTYNVTPMNYNGEIELIPFLDGDIKNEDSNYDEKFWAPVNSEFKDDIAILTEKTKKLDFQVTVASSFDIFKDNLPLAKAGEKTVEEKFLSHSVKVSASKGETVTLNKYVAVTSNRYMEVTETETKAVALLNLAKEAGFNTLLSEHKAKWHESWENNDIVIKGDVKAQQSIRFNIFHLHQTYTGEDERLNIGPKGFTGEKYGGSTYWDTEAYCLPFYLSTADEKIAKNLLIYRNNHLEKAKENAKKLGLRGALYPMVTMNGEECHNEWEITFEEIHRNGAIAYAIFNYVRYTGDEKHLAEYGIDVLVEISRFWESRVNFSQAKNAYVMLGVTGPNEYENNVNNNWYTNRLAAWTLDYTMEVIELLKEKYSNEYETIVARLGFNDEELNKWKHVRDNMYYPVEENLNIFLQQDGYMDKDQTLVKDLPKEALPLNQKWSWDMILRSPFIKQADVLQGLYFFRHLYDVDTKKRNFDFYEPRTVHESSLSPCVHSILAAEIGYEDKAYEMYLRTARLDLDNVNNDTDDGLHITSMAGTWMSIVEGFGGMKIENDKISLTPFIPEVWENYSFKILFRGNKINVSVNKENISITLEQGSELTITVFKKDYTLSKDKSVVINH